MLPSLSEGESTFTRLQVQEILRTESYVRQPGTRGTPLEFDASSFDRSQEDGMYIYYSLAGRQTRVRNWCMELEAQIMDPTSHLEVLDMWLSKLLKCNFQPVDPEKTVVESVYNMLTRIPRTPPELHDHLVDTPYAGLHQGYFLKDSSPAWENLRAANFVSRNTIRLALQIQIALAGPHWFAGVFRSFVNVIAEVLRMAIDLSKEQPSKEWFIFKAFLWTSWQRAMYLYHYYVLEVQLLGGYDSARDSSLDGLDNIHKALSSERNMRETQVPAYMCRWAFRLLEADKASVGQDYRRFLQRFAQTFEGRTPRCIVSSEGPATSCDGRQPDQCLRLSGMQIKNQSAHTHDCNGNCPRLYWNEESWKAIGGLAAVSLNLGDDGLLNYCEASEKTMAVSHVWSHGQGGRPENNAAKEGTGLNSCLHRRYAKIAESYGCDSYWMDTPCIPSNHVLRREAIENINRVFANSKLMLICDRDLMAIDVRRLDLAVQESLLATILVCDWNVRAWTLLEALRGRRNIYVLCKDDLTVSFRETVQTVNREGCVDIAALFLSAQHLLPTQSYVGGVGLDHTAQSLQWVIDRRKGFVNFREAAGLLSHRHASRPGDEVVIWGLLSGDEVFSTAESFWRRREGNIVPTDWLISSIPRLSGAKGLSWAPCRPNFPLLGRDPGGDYDQLLFPYSSGNSEYNRITKEGLRGHWWAYEFRVPRGIIAYLRENARRIGLTSGGAGLEIERAAIPYLQNQQWCALLQPVRSNTQDRPMPHLRRFSKQIFVVVASGDRLAWQWKGLLEMDNDVVLPQFSAKEFLIE